LHCIHIVHAHPRGILEPKILEAKYEAKVEFLGGGGEEGSAKQKTFCGGSMDILWNCTFLPKTVEMKSLKLHPNLCFFSAFTRDRVNEKGQIVFFLHIIK